MPRAIDDAELLRLYAQPGRGYTDQELAEVFEVGRDAIFKRRRRFKDLYGDDFFAETERGRYRVDTETFVSHIKVKKEEALILYLATRRLSRNTRLPQKPVLNALSKLASALYNPMTERLVKAAGNVPHHPEEKKREAILQTLLKGWAEQLKVHIRYQSLKSNKPANYTIDVYLIEPSPWSDSIYIIAKNNVWDGFTPYQLERIEKATLSGESFDIDPHFENEQLLQYTWGIWNSDKEPQLVRLHFTAPVAVRRVQESIWHPRQEMTIQPDGTLIWQAAIAEPKEMLPWVRGWGADVEVLEPTGLRDIIMRHAQQLNKTYNLTTSSTDITARLLQLWGKTTADSDVFHPALYHMFDVAHIAQQLLSPRASVRWRQALAGALNADAATLHEWLPYLIALHDIGKLSVPFQIMNDKQWMRLKAEGFDFGKAKLIDGKKLHHTIVGRFILEEETSLNLSGNVSAACM